MMVDGRGIANDILTAVKQHAAALSFTPKLGIVTCAPGPETQQYLELKQRKAKEVGIELVVLELPATATTDDCIDSVEQLLAHAHGVVVQLPLPATIDRESVLKAVPANKDPDGFSYGQEETTVLPPVVAAINHLAELNELTFKDKAVVVLGSGRLVGQPAAWYARALGAKVTILTEESPHYLETLQQADIIISGVGQPHFITADMVREAVVIFDAGASEDGGVVVGDVAPNVSHKASLFTPVPGGIGPITVALLLANLLKLIRGS